MTTELRIRVSRDFLTASLMHRGKDTPIFFPADTLSTTVAFNDNVFIHNCNEALFPPTVILRDCFSLLGLPASGVEFASAQQRLSNVGLDNKGRVCYTVTDAGQTVILYPDAVVTYLIKHILGCAGSVSNIVVTLPVTFSGAQFSEISRVVALVVPHAICIRERTRTAEGPVSRLSVPQPPSPDAPPRQPTMGLPVQETLAELRSCVESLERSSMVLTRDNESLRAQVTLYQSEHHTMASEIGCLRDMVMSISTRLTSLDPLVDNFQEDLIQQSVNDTSIDVYKRSVAMQFIIDTAIDPPAEIRPSHLRQCDVDGRCIVDLYLMHIDTVLPPWLMALVHKENRLQSVANGLVSRGNNEVDAKGRTRFMNQVLLGLEHVRFIDRHTDMDMQDCEGQTTIMLWINFLESKPPQFLQQSNRDLQDIYGSTGMAWWISMLKTEPPRWIRQSNMDIQDHDGRTAMVLWINLIRTEPPPSIRQTDMSICDKNGYVPMMVWIREMASEPPEWMIQSDINYQACDGCTAMMLWIVHIRTLPPAWCHQTSMDLQDNKGYTAMMHWIITFKNVPPDWVRQSNMDIVDAEGNTALMLWIIAVKVRPPKWLMHGDPNKQNGKGATAMMLWISATDSEPPTWLRQTDMDIASTDEGTALMWWLRFVEAEPPLYLIPKNLSITDKEGHTAVQLWSLCLDVPRPLWLSYATQEQNLNVTPEPSLG